MLAWWSRDKSDKSSSVGVGIESSAQKLGPCMTAPKAHSFNTDKTRLMHVEAGQEILLLNPDQEECSSPSSILDEQLQWPLLFASSSCQQLLPVSVPENSMTISPALLDPHQHAVGMGSSHVLGSPQVKAMHQVQPAWVWLNKQGQKMQGCPFHGHERHAQSQEGPWSKASSLMNSFGQESRPLTLPALRFFLKDCFEFHRLYIPGDKP